MLDHTAAGFLSALRARGVERIQYVRFKANRSTLLSVSRDRVTLNAHECFRRAPPGVLDAIAGFLTARRGSRELEGALARIRGWRGAREGIAAARRQSLGGERGSGGVLNGRCVATPDQIRELERLYDRLNETRFEGRLPAGVRIRLSPRMSRGLGLVRYDRTPDGARRVLEIALNPALLRRRNRTELVETVLHEMAHVEAWLAHGHPGHGAVWKAIARRVGCEPRACARRLLRGAGTGNGRAR